MPDERIAQAIEALDRAIAAAPERDGHAFSLAVTQLSLVRDEAAAGEGRRTAESRQRLTRINAVLSTIMAGHFPLGDPPWNEVRNARRWLAELNDASTDGSGASGLGK